LWAFGCIVYAILIGDSPFKSKSSYDTYEKVRIGAFDIPDFVPEDAADLIRCLLVGDPAQRLGAGTAEQGHQAIRRHRFVAGITDWERLSTQEVTIVANPRAAEWRQAILRQTEELEIAIKEMVIRSEKVTFFRPTGEIDADLVLTDAGRVVVK
jgi:serine/threonine protein kinase